MWKFGFWLNLRRPIPPPLLTWTPLSGNIVVLEHFQACFKHKKTELITGWAFKTPSPLLISTKNPSFTFVKAFPYYCRKQHLLKSIVQNFCSQFLRTIFAHNFCSKLLFTIFFTSLFSNLLFTTLVHNICS